MRETEFKISYVCECCNKIHSWTETELSQVSPHPVHGKIGVVDLAVEMLSKGQPFSLEIVKKGEKH